MRTRLELGTSGTIDLNDDIPYSLNYSIADVREPDKRNASFSKTITIPGSKNNNKIFQHKHMSMHKGQFICKKTMLLNYIKTQ